MIKHSIRWPYELCAPFMYKLQRIYATATKNCMNLCGMVNYYNRKKLIFCHGLVFVRRDACSFYVINWCTDFCFFYEFLSSKNEKKNASAWYSQLCRAILLDCALFIHKILVLQTINSHACLCRKGHTIFKIPLSILLCVLL